MTQSQLDEIASLLQRVPRAPEEDLPPGAAPALVADFERRLPGRIPAELRQLILLTNGPCVGPGGLFGIKTANDSLDLEEVYSLHPTWAAHSWFPIAGDGCGNYYVAAKCGDRWPVVFVDTAEDPSAVAYVVASGVLRFVAFLLQKELGTEGWPFRRDYVVGSDPDILEMSRCFPLPWA